eukprot:5245977-Karenia_brevis.AAC.1
MFQAGWPDDSKEFTRHATSHMFNSIACGAVFIASKTKECGSKLLWELKYLHSHLAFQEDLWDWLWRRKNRGTDERLKAYLQVE